MSTPSNMCPQCPFARSTPKTYLDTMGDNAERFAGQAVGTFALPCHMHSKFDQCMKDIHAPKPCAGAAIYRANCGYEYLRESLPVADEKNTEDVFASPAELIAHHRAITIEEAEHLLRKKPLGAMYREELQRTAVRLFITPKKP